MTPQDKPLDKIDAPSGYHAREHAIRDPQIYHSHYETSHAVSESAVVSDRILA